MRKRKPKLTNRHSSSRRRSIDDNDTINVVHRRRRVHEQDLMDDDLEDMVRNTEVISDYMNRMFVLQDGRFSLLYGFVLALV